MAASACDSERRLICEVFRGAGAAEEQEVRWPHADYAACARECAKDQIALEVLRGLAEDLEALVDLRSGPGSFVRLAKSPLPVLRPLAGRSWRDVLLDPSLGRAQWRAVFNFAAHLEPPRRSQARYTCQLLQGVAVARLIALGDGLSAPMRACARELPALAEKSYVFAALRKVIREAARTHGGSHGHAR
jgi:hypothetical protein